MSDVKRYVLSNHTINGLGYMNPIWNDEPINLDQQFVSLRDYEQDITAEREKVKELERRFGPKIVCLCGSTRFKKAFDEENYRETMAGNIVLSVGFYVHSIYEVHGEGVGCTPEQKIALDELHKRKIDLCDEVLILNVGGYIGSSTQSEIEYARAHNKPIRWIEPDKALQDKS